MVNAFTALEPRQNLVLFGVQLGRNDFFDRLADHLVRLVAEDAGRARVPRHDLALEGLADDRIVGVRHDGGEVRGLHFGLRVLGDVDEEVDRADHPALRSAIASTPRTGSPVLSVTAIGHSSWGRRVASSR